MTAALSALLGALLLASAPAADVTTMPMPLVLAQAEGGDAPPVPPRGCGTRRPPVMS